MNENPALWWTNFGYQAHPVRAVGGVAGVWWTSSITNTYFLESYRFVAELYYHYVTYQSNSFCTCTCCGPCSSQWGLGRGVTLSSNMCYLGNNCLSRIKSEHVLACAVSTHLCVLSLHVVAERKQHSKEVLRRASKVCAETAHFS